MLKDVRINPRHIANGITANHRGFPVNKELRLFGADTETYNTPQGGVPFTFQVAFADGGKINHETIQRCTSKNILNKMMDWILPRCTSESLNLVYFHNLNFDIKAVFYPDLQAIFDQYNDVKLTRHRAGTIERGDYYGYSIKMLYGRVNQVTVWEDYGGYICSRCGGCPVEATSYSEGYRICTRHQNCEPKVRRNYGKRVEFLDSAAFCPPGSKSLAAALKIYGVSYTKMAYQEKWSRGKTFTQEFQKYALNDARAELGLAQKIIEVHRKYDSPICVSLPQLAGRILRHHYFEAKDRMIFPPNPCRIASEFSYHAGKNGFYVRPGIYEDVYEYDINSAFPKAMLELPSLSVGKYKKTNVFEEGKMGIYMISGYALGAKYAAIFDHAFRPIVKGPFRRVWVTGFELECLQNNRDYEYKIRQGWTFDPSGPSTGAAVQSPLRKYVEEFWRLKSEAPKGPLRDLYKNLLNSLYGKFAACVEHRERVKTPFGYEALTEGGNNYFVAGSLYHPFLASQITGYVRRELYRLEQRGHAFHSATDSIKSKLDLAASEGLGGIKKEVFGRCYLFRTKLYLHFAKDNSLCGHDVEKGWIRKGRTGEFGKIFDQGVADECPQHLCKWAMHGFKGDVFELYERRHELLSTGFIDYEYRHMVNLREGIKRHEPVNTMVPRRERLLLPGFLEKTTV